MLSTIVVTFLPQILFFVFRLTPQKKSVKINTNERAMIQPKKVIVVNPVKYF
jgi:hypothetical protein